MLAVPESKILITVLPPICTATSSNQAVSPTRNDFPSHLLSLRGFLRGMSGETYTATVSPDKSFLKNLSQQIELPLNQREGALRSGLDSAFPQSDGPNGLFRCDCGKLFEQPMFCRFSMFLLPSTHLWPLPWRLLQLGSQSVLLRQKPKQSLRY